MYEMGITVCDLSYRHPNQHTLLEHIGFSVLHNDKVSITGNNGSGKSTLLKLLAGELVALSGSVRYSSQPYYLPQQIGAIGKNVSEALGVAEKLNALRLICNGSAGQQHYDQLADEWDIESKCRSALDHWGLTNVDYSTPVDSLSGGEKTKVFLAGLHLHKPGIVLLDEPTNHLDRTGRQKLYDYIAGCKASLVVVSHDTALLDLVETTYELSEKGLRLYGGNFSFYKKQKEIEEESLAQRINAEETALRLACRKAREIKERQEKRISRVEKTTTGIPRIILQGRQSKGENTAAKLSGRHQEIIAENQNKLTGMRRRQRKSCELKIDFDNARLHDGKTMVAATNMNFGYEKGRTLWRTPLNLVVRSGERIHIKGDNGTGKTTLIKLLTGELTPSEGKVMITDFSYVYLDQQYGQVNRDRSVLELAEEYNENQLADHQIKTRLNRALFPKDMWDRNCLTLSGGERMRLYLCCLMLSNHIPDMLILDEPSNNLDMSSLSILTETIKNYKGTLLVISHDTYFVNRIEINKSIELL